MPPLISTSPVERKPSLWWGEYKSSVSRTLFRFYDTFKIYKDWFCSLKNLVSHLDPVISVSAVELSLHRSSPTFEQYNEWKSKIPWRNTKQNCLSSLRFQNIHITIANWFGSHARSPLWSCLLTQGWVHPFYIKVHITNGSSKNYLIDVTEQLKNVLLLG